MSKPVKYRLKIKNGNQKKTYVIQQKFMLLWVIPLWFDTNISGNNPSSLTKIVTKMNRSS